MSQYFCEPPEPDHTALHWEGFGRSFQHVSVMQGLERCCGFGFFSLNQYRNCYCTIAMSKIVSQRFEEVVFSLPLLTFSGFAN